jgi:hypothetical protein
VVETAPLVWFILPILDIVVLVVLYRQRQFLLLVLWSALFLLLLASALGVLELAIQLATLKLQEALSHSGPGR